MSVEKVRAELGEDAELFDFYEENGYIIAKPKQKIDTEDFKRIAKTLKQFGADYVRYNYKSKTGGLFHVKKEEAMSTVTSQPYREGVSFVCPHCIKPLNLRVELRKGE